MSTFDPRDPILIREELADITAYLTNLPGDLATSPAFDAYRTRATMLREELHYALLDAEVPGGVVIETRLTSEDAPSSSQLSASVLGGFLQRWQTLIDALGQAASGRPTKRGTIARDVLAETQMAVYAFARGSFAVRMSFAPSEQFDLLQRPSHGVRGYELLQELVGAGDDFDALALIAKKARVRATSAFGKLLELLRLERLSLISAARFPVAGRRFAFVRLDGAKADSVLEALGRVSSLQQETMTVTGVLTGANLRTGTFEIDAGDDGVIVGKVAKQKSSLLRGCPLGQVYAFELEEMLEQSLTDEVTTAYELRGISRPGGKDA